MTAWAAWGAQRFSEKCVAGHRRTGSAAAGGGTGGNAAAALAGLVLDKAV